MTTSNCALRTSDSHPSNDGSTIKIGHFLDDIKPSEIKVPSPEISNFWKKLNIASAKTNFRKQIHENELNFLETRKENEIFQKLLN